jgi:hypothetical protein
MRPISSPAIPDQRPLSLQVHTACDTLKLAAALSSGLHAADADTEQSLAESTRVPRRNVVREILESRMLAVAARAHRATPSKGEVDMPKGTEKKKTTNKPKLTVKEKKEKKKKAKSG